MATHEQSTSVDAPADALFAYLSDIANLPKYFTRMTSAEPTGEANTDGDEGGQKIRTTAEIDPDGDGQMRHVEGEAWFRVDDAAKRLAWGSPGPNDYHGELRVSDDGASSTVAVTLHTTRVDGPPIDDGLRETLANIKRLVEAA